MDKVELLTTEEWNDWFDQPQTKELFKKLEKYKEEKLEAATVHLLSGNTHDAIISSGAILALQEINDIFHDLKHGRAHD